MLGMNGIVDAQPKAVDTTFERCAGRLAYCAALHKNDDASIK
jgi:hypothetical protein